MSGIPQHNMAKARALEIPAFTIMKQVMTTKLNKPFKEYQSGSLWTVEWKTSSHAWVLEYESRPQTSLTGNKVPDFIVKRDRKELLAVECKNWAMKSKWSYLSAKRDIIERFDWLLSRCDRVLLTTHLNAKTGYESVKISNAMITNHIRVEKLGTVAGPGGLTGNKLYRNIAPKVSNWLGFIHKSRSKQRAVKRGQQRITKYTQTKRSRRQ